MKTTHFVNFCIMVALVLAVLVPMPAHAHPIKQSEAGATSFAAKNKTASLTVQNESGGTLYVTLSGPRYYNFATSKAGKAEFTNIEPGKYTITLSASTCPDVVTVTRNIDAKVNLKEKKEIVCAQKAAGDKEKQKAAHKPASLIVFNESGGTLFINLSGPKYYNFSTSKAGKTEFPNIEPGKYTITVRASTCPEVVTLTQNIVGKASLSGNKQKVCVQKAAEKDKDKQKAGTLAVDNRTGGVLYVTLTGPQTYYFNTSKQGKDKFSGIASGKYTISVRSSACAGVLTYTMNIKGNASLKAFFCGK